ncbi:MAG: hypothetical protein C5B54_01910 [Acidobacteria bacterium]|nr:MAG: hypothetical protein C5B54_01910 [Acidobacteriota bacterium]
MLNTKPHNRAIEVTEDDIENGIPRTSGYCPISQAIYRSVPNARRALADMAFIRWTDPIKRKRYIFTSPQSVIQFLIDYDFGDRTRCKPFSFRLYSAVQIVDMRERTPEQKAKRKKREKAIKQGTTKIGGRTKPMVRTKNINNQDGTNRQWVRKFGARVLIP